MIWDVRENQCCIGFDYDTELKLAAEGPDKETTCELPEGNIIMIGAECFRCVAFFSCPVLLVKKPVDSTTHLGRAS